MDGAGCGLQDRIARYDRDSNGDISLVIVGGIAAYGLIIVSHTCRVEWQGGKVAFCGLVGGGLGSRTDDKRGPADNANSATPVPGTLPRLRHVMGSGSQLGQSTNLLGNEEFCMAILDDHVLAAI